MPSDSQRAIVGACPSRIAVAQHPLAQAVDLEQDHPRDVGAIVLGGAASHPSPHDAQVAGVAVHVEQRRDEHRDERQPERDRQVAPERGRLAVDHVERERDRAGAEGERAEPEGEDRQRQRQARDDAATAPR